MIKYKKFKIGQLFDVELSKGDLKESHTISSPETGYIPLVSAGDTNNGVVGYVDGVGDGKAQMFPANAITVDMFCKAYFHSQKFYAVSHGRVNILIPRFHMNVYKGLYLCSVINGERYRFNYGRAVYSSVIKRLEISLPVNNCEEPDWEYMESYVKELPSLNVCLSKLDNTASCHNSDPLLKIKQLLVRERGENELLRSIIQWKKFRIGSLFHLQKGKRLTDADKVEGKLPFIGAIDSSNGVSAYIDEQPIHSGNVITINYNGSVGEAFYQPVPFWASDDVNVLYPNGWELNPAIGLFICTVIRNEKYRFSYGRKWKLDRMEESEIWLPSDKQGNPDWQYMEDYIKSLPAGDKLENL
ncbi:restriction endonuclease subunit S [Akkermansia muciniphila]|uniref:restriction endonuclease subunit S n=1 Tax=Akkermansia muciniphila TaxID=239935 RepID=UPI0027D20C32|nr:restriction endonuclease subunit S [Akkermansia muciniphila]WMB15936.1 restriction endonuclease subunit S [Akkermansia muciniphila]WMB20513.1 restriction endonuclease subunit S [Akkermansia muciniphila]